MTSRKPSARPRRSPRRRIDAPGIARLVLENVRCFARAEVPLDAGVTVIIGQNGSGKTTIAEAIASLAHGAGEGHDDFPVRQGAARGRIALLGADGVPLAGWTVGAREPDRTSLIPGQVYAYGQVRALRPAPAPGRGAAPAILGPAFQRAELRPLPQSLSDAARRPATATLFRFDEDLFRDLAAYAALLHDEGASNPAARAAWARFAGWLTGLDKRIDGVAIEDHEGGRRAVFRRRGLPRALPITALSDGYRAMLAVVLDLVIRYAVIFASLEHPLDGEAMVVVDEVDLNLHPRWQREIIRQLVALFPRTRFVLTTHSAAVVQAAIDERHRILVLEETEGEGTQVVPLAPGELRRLDGAEIDSVLVEVFGSPSRYSPTYEDVEREAARLGEALEGEAATAEDRGRLLDVLDELQGLLAKHDEMTRTGPLMSRIAQTQMALLRRLDGEIPGKKKRAR
jgi:hypothetical protein